MAWGDAVEPHSQSERATGSAGVPGTGRESDEPRAGEPGGSNGGASAVPGPSTSEDDRLQDDRLRVLRLVQQGKLTPEQAVKLLDALAPPAAPGSAAGTSRPAGDAGARASRAQPPGTPTYALPAKGRMLRIRIVEDGEDRVNLNIPLGLARSALRLIPARAQRHLAGVDLEALMEEIEHGATGKILVIRDEDDSGVEVVVE